MMTCVTVKAKLYIIFVIYNIPASLREPCSVSNDDEDVFPTRYIRHVTEQIAATAVIHVHGYTVGRSQALDAAVYDRTVDVRESRSCKTYRTVT